MLIFSWFFKYKYLSSHDILHLEYYKWHTHIHTHNRHILMITRIHVLYCHYNSIQYLLYYWINSIMTGRECVTQFYIFYRFLIQLTQFYITPTKPQWNHSPARTLKPQQNLNRNQRQSRRESAARTSNKITAVANCKPTMKSQ